MASIYTTDGNGPAAGLHGSIVAGIGGHTMSSFADIPANWIFVVPQDNDGRDYTKGAEGGVTQEGMVSLSPQEASEAFAGAQCRLICLAGE